MYISDSFNTGILVTNQVSLDPDPCFDDPTQSIGSNILDYISTFRIYLRKSKGNKRIVCPVDAPNLADDEVIMRVQDADLEPE